jgi:hypothetical protein
VNQVELSEADNEGWVMDAKDKVDGESDGLQQRGLSTGKAKDDALSPLSSSYDEDDGDLHMLYSINSTPK